MFKKNTGNIKSVSEITSEIQEYFHHSFHFVKIIGEVSGLSIPSSGHHYFSLKDENSRLRAVIFRNQTRYLTESLRDGMQVICTGRISVYEPRGEYQIIIDSVQVVGSGTLHAEFEILKAHLKSKGYFDAERKLPIPDVISKVALITSPTGAAVKDFLAICQNRFHDFSILIIPVSVQGVQSAPDISEAIKKAHQTGADIIVLTRGGGSIEDLWSFNEERVAEAIYHSELPVISAIGHETDFTIADFCADLRCPTPTAAAQHLTRDKQRFTNLLTREKHKLINSFSRLVQDREYELVNLHNRLTKLDYFYDKRSLKLDYLRMNIIEKFSTVLDKNGYDLLTVLSRIHQCNPARKIELRQQEVSFQHSRMIRATLHFLENRNSALAAAASRIDSVSPLATLSRGYSIVQKIPPEKPEESRVITEANQVKTGDKLQITLKKGKIISEVSSTS